MSNDGADMVINALRRAWDLGKTYYHQADSESYSQNKKSDETQIKFETLIEETRAALSRPALHEVAEMISMPITDFLESITGILNIANKTCVTLEQERDTLCARVSQLEKDAGRYRWLRNRLPGSSYRIAGVIYSEGGAGVDVAIDAAIASQKEAP